MKKYFSILSVFCIALTIFACSQKPGSQAETKEVTLYKIGVIAPLSGDTSAYGEQVKKIFDYRLTEINQLAKDKGYKIDIVYEDGRCEGESAKLALQKLVDYNNIHFLIGGVCSSESLSVAPLLAEKKALMVSSTSSSPDLEGKSQYFFSLSYSDLAVGEGIARELGKYKKVALISEQIDFNQGIKKTVEKDLQQKYPQTAIVANQEFPKGATAFQEELEIIKNSGAEAVLLNPNAGQTAKNLLTQLANFKDWNPQFISEYAYLSKRILESAPEKVEGMVIIDAPNINDEKFIAYRNKIVEANGTLDNLGNYYSATSLDALNILTELIPEYEGDLEKIREALSTRTFKGWTGETIIFGGKSFVQGVPVTKFVVRGGEALPLN